MSFAPSAAAVWHCDRGRIPCERSSARQSVFVKRWERPPPSAPFVLDSAPLPFFCLCYVGAWYRKRGTGRNPCGSRTVPLFVFFVCRGLRYHRDSDQFPFFGGLSPSDLSCAFLSLSILLPSLSFVFCCFLCLPFLPFPFFTLLFCVSSPFVRIAFVWQGV